MRSVTLLSFSNGNTFSNGLSLTMGVQVGAGGLRVSLPRRSRGRRVLVPRQPHQRRGPGLQQRGQLHVTAAAQHFTHCHTAAQSHNAKHTDSRVRAVPGEHQLTFR